jgi:nucleoside phosphorylase
MLLLEGSAAPDTSVERLRLAHDVVRRVVGEAWEQGLGFSVLGNVEESHPSDASLALTFAWTVIREVARLGEQHSPSDPRLRVITAKKFTDGKLSPDHRALLSRLHVANVAEVVLLPDAGWTGGTIREAQLADACGMICVGGGKGVFVLADALLKSGRPVLPLDLHIEGAQKDGGGAMELNRELQAAPGRFFPHTGDQVARSLFSLSLVGEPADPATAAAAAVRAISREHEAARAARGMDVLILAALPVELGAVQDALGIPPGTAPRATAHGTNTWLADLGGARVGVASLGGAGNLGAAATTTELLGVTGAKLVVMAGIAAGQRGKRLLGEVVISEEVVHYEPGALVDTDGVRRLAGRPRTWASPHRVAQAVAACLARQPDAEGRLHQRISARGIQLPSSDQKVAVQAPALGQATIGSGEKLIRDAVAWVDLRELHGKIDVADMESAGVADAATRRNIPFAIFRGVSDFGDKEKDNRYHRIAAALAAEATVDFLLNHWAVSRA